MPADKFAPTTWAESTVELTVPSGQMCLARRPDPAQLAEDGLLHKLDGLTSLVDQKHVSRKAKGGKNSAQSQRMNDDMALANLAKDPEKLSAALKAIDQIVLKTVLKPSLQIPPEDWEDREDGVVYLDTVGIEDKMFLVNFAVGGTRDIASFRTELKERVDNLANVESVESPA